MCASTSANARVRRANAPEPFAAATTSVQAMRTIFDERRIDGRAVGDLAWGELLRACHTRALIAASALQQTNEATEDAILLNKIEAFARVDDHSRKVQGRSVGRRS